MLAQLILLLYRRLYPIAKVLHFTELESRRNFPKTILVRDSILSSQFCYSELPDELDS
jgi:hypothetical protein